MHDQQPIKPVATAQPPFRQQFQTLHQYQPQQQQQQHV